MASFYHLLVTKFNVKMQPDYSLNVLESWTAERIHLFSKYCLPSIVNQSNKKFQWLLQIDDSTSDSNFDYIQELSQKYSFIHFVKLLDYTNPAESIQQFVNRQNPNAEYLITTRIDNDDVLHQNFIQEIQNQFKNSKKERLVNFLNGYTLDITETPFLLFKCVQNQNPFITLIEPMSDNLRTVRGFKHNEWSGQVEIENIDTIPLWLQLIHGKNVLNSIVGQPIAKPTDLNVFQLKNEDATHINIRLHKRKKQQLFFKKIRNKLLLK